MKISKIRDRCCRIIIKFHLRNIHLKTKCNRLILLLIIFLFTHKIHAPQRETHSGLEHPKLTGQPHEGGLVHNRNRITTEWRRRQRQQWPRIPPPNTTLHRCFIFNKFFLLLLLLTFYSFSFAKQKTKYFTRT